MELFQKLFPKAAKVEAAERRAEVAEAETAAAKREVAALWQSYNAHDATVQKQREEIASLKDKLREQNDADLMLASGKIICAVLRGEKPKDEDVFQHSALMQQRQAMSLGSPYGYGMSNAGIGSALFGLGALGGIWRQ